MKIPYYILLIRENTLLVDQRNLSPMMEVALATMLEIEYAKDAGVLFFRKLQKKQIQIQPWTD
jgi:hypothetical protein